MSLKKSFQLILLCCAPLLSSAVNIERDVQYSPINKGEFNKLDIYYPKLKGDAKDVIIFIHGGSWRSGNKKEYWWLGRNFARKNTIAVIINYPLSPKSGYEEMAYDCAEAVKWVQSNISKYGGNPDRIFLMGHSAGAHLSALINQDKRFFAKAGIKNPLKGVILDDAFGLDMYQYITTDRNSDYIPGFLETFTKDEEVWKKGSPMNYTTSSPNPYLIFVGKKTFPSIRLQSPIFYKKVKSFQNNSEFMEIKGKKHVGMIAQMFFGCNKLYDYILDFMKKN
jgi:acetyl esterase/lipase